jgi:hypothetical protein
MATILETLQNANYNLSNARHAIQLAIAQNQLNNAVALLEKGYGLHHEVETLLAAHPTLESVPPIGPDFFDHLQPTTNATK